MKRLFTFALIALLAQRAGAYHWFNDAGTGPAAGTFVFQHWAAATIHYIVDNEPLPAGLTIAGNIVPAYDTWQAVPTSAIAFALDPNTTGVANYNVANSALNPAAPSPVWGINNDGQNEVVFLHNGDVTDDPLGVGIGTVNTDNGEIVDFVLLINIDSSGGTDPTLRAVMVHEIGHTIGIGHSAVGSPNFTFFPVPAVERPTMYPFAFPGDLNRAESLEPDDALAVSRIYPDPSFRAGQKLSGRVLKGTDGSFARGVHVRAVSVANPNDQVGIISDREGLGTGAWDIPGLPTGNWNVVINPISGASPPNATGRIEDDGIGSTATTYIGFPAEHFDSAESNHDTATSLVSLPVFADFDTHNVVVVTNQGTGPDPAITPWGYDQAPPAPPWWQTPDIWVDNDGAVPNEANEPERGRSNNQLFARITNRGGSDASGYRVTFAFRPYTTSAAAPAVTIGSVPEGGTLAMGASRTYSITWNLSDTFIQANFPPAFWSADHFCVIVTIEATGGGPVASDSNPSNNQAQNNFANVPLCTTCFQRVDFYVYNHLDRPARASLEFTRRQGRGTLQFAGIDDRANIQLNAREFRKVTARLDSEANDTSVFDVTQRLDSAIVGGITIALAPPSSTTIGGTGGTGGPTSLTGRTFLGVSSGGNWPLGEMNRLYDPSFYFSLQLERTIAPRARLALQLGYHQFDEGIAEPLAPNLGITNVSVLARVLGASGSTARPFVIFGPGAYRAGGSWHAGLQAGVGYEVPVTSSIALTTGATLHLVNADEPRPRWVDGYLGFLFRIP